MKNRNKKVLKFIAIFLLVLIVFPNLSSVFGEINELYKRPAKTSDGLVLSGNESGNIITKAVFWLINTIGSIGESLLTNFATVLSSAAKQTSTSTTSDVATYDSRAGAIMPWADAIVYNAVPALDVNFINPSTNSFSSIMSNVISKMYYTIFSISITFFGIAVLIMAIRLATTAIAAEKARYKESITNFIISLILIFSMHYFMSFVFYLNESLVKVAYSIAEITLKGEFINLTGNVTDRQKAIVDEISNGSNDNWFEGTDGGDSSIISTVGNWLSGDNIVANQYQTLEIFISWKLFDESNENYTKAAAAICNACPAFLSDRDGNDFFTSDSVSKSVMLLCLADTVLKGTTFSNADLNSAYDTEKTGAIKLDNNKLYQALLESYNDQFKPAMIGNSEIDLSLRREFRYIYYDNFEVNANCKYSDSEKEMMVAINDAVAYMGNTSVGTSGTTGNKMEELGTSIVSQLATYFKMKRYTTDNDISLVGALVYTIFVFQSIMYFFVYLKRFFYIIILAFFAPFLVLFDFLNKAIGRQSDTLSKWIKEFCSLVFVQSIQAFLLTMISSLVININNAANSSISEANAQGLAVINIIALASMSKIENLISDMLGLKSSIADTSLSGGAKMGMHGLAGGLATIAGLKRLGDNGKKIAGGARNIASARKDYKNALAAKNKKLDQFAELSNAGADGASGVAGNEGSSLPQGTLVGGTANNARNLPEGKLGLGNEADSVQGSSSSIGATGGKTSGLTIKDKHKYQDALDNCDAKIAEAQKKMREAKWGLVGGIAETGGSIVGGTTGAIFAGTAHAAAGNFNVQDVVADAIKGAGAGDYIAEELHNSITGAVGMARDIRGGNGKKNIKDAIKQKQKDIKAAYEKAGFDVSDLD